MEKSIEKMMDTTKQNEYKVISMFNINVKKYSLVHTMSFGLFETKFKLLPRTCPYSIYLFNINHSNILKTFAFHAFKSKKQ